MTNLRSGFLIIFLVLAVITVVSEANAHSMFNSAESTLEGYRIQIATLPEFPQIGETSQILFRVTDVNFEEVEEFTLGARVFFNGKQIDAIPPNTYEGGHVEMDFVWTNSGNHIVRVDLYNMEGAAEILTYTFNMGTQSPFGYIFFIAIIIGALMLGIVVTYVYFPEKLKFKFNS